MFRNGDSLTIADISGPILVYIITNWTQFQKWYSTTAAITIQTRKYQDEIGTRTGCFIHTIKFYLSRVWNLFTLKCDSFQLCTHTHTELKHPNDNDLFIKILSNIEIEKKMLFRYSLKISQLTVNQKSRTTFSSKLNSYSLFRFLFIHF